ncbi:MAG: rhomboid family intramembrane serine protease [Planctomycetales bacterium]
MIPLRDNIPPRSFPFVNYLMIALCTLAFLTQLMERSSQQDQLVARLGMIPVRVLHPRESITVTQEALVRSGQGYQQVTVERTLPPLPFSPWWTLLTCIFLHGGWMHFLGNMWFLHIFGDNVEDRFGHWGYGLFYLGSGAAASLSHLISNPQSAIPTIGASGAIAGVMGAYLWLYPRAKVMTLLPLGMFTQMLVVPAPFFLILWFLMQFFEGTFAITAGKSGGVAWWAHIGGFVIGLGVAWLLDKVHLARAPVDIIRPHTDRTRIYRLPRQ